MKTAAHDLDGLDAALDTGGKLTIGDGVGEDEIHFLGGPLTLGVARRLLIVIAAPSFLPYRMILANMTAFILSIL